MTDTVFIKLEKPLGSVEVMDLATPLENQPSAQTCDVSQQAVENAHLIELCQNMTEIIDKAAACYQQILVESKDTIAHLSVEIAARILGQKIQDGDYKIEDIVKNSLNSVEEPGNVVVYLNPADYETILLMKDADGQNILKDMEFIADNSLGKAECKIKTLQGTLETLIEKQLDQVKNAFRKMAC
jgi:flagellar assembly protein FliH